MSVLKSIAEGVLLDLEKRRVSDSELAEMIATAAAPLDSLSSLRSKSFSIISEVKRSSPSKGELAQIPKPESLAQTYEKAGAAVVSVLTEQQRFGGSISDLQAVKANIRIPVLRKDFIVNEYLVKETRAYGADLMLLIVAALDKSELRDFYQLAEALGMQVLIEVHDQGELETALDLNPKIIGVNSRNLKTLEIDLGNFARLLPLIPSHIYKVAESGISTIDDVKMARSAGADAILVGETLVKSGDPFKTISDFLNIDNQD
ncbi:MAG: hypothetical protein RIR35_449 [Actinomycetota bacterium]|jgi:indole-3-glycerol phosphate synthase